MSKSWNRPHTWLGLIVVGVSLLVVAIAGMHAYMVATATPLHPEADTAPAVAHADVPPRWTDAVRRGRLAARTALAEKNLPGVSVAVGVDGRLAWAEGFGWADLEGRVKVTPDTRFRIGTASTMLTSAAAGLLLEEERLKLDAEIQAYVPQYPRKSWPVTLRQLMAHQAGVGTDSGDEGPMYGTRCERPADGLRFFADDDLLFQPGMRYRYSSYGWTLVSAAIEAAAGEPFFTFMEARVFEPLQMESTRPESTTGSIPKLATAYFPRYAADPRYGPDVMREVHHSCYGGANGIVSTPSDLVRFGMAMTGGSLLRPATVALLQTAQRLPSGQETGYGLGWDLETVPLAGQPTVVVGHDGDVLGGPVASVMIVRDRRLVVAVTSNTSYANTAELARQIAEAFIARSS